MEEHLRIIGQKHILADSNKLDNYIYEKGRINRKTYTLTRFMLSHVEESVFAKNQVFTLTSTKEPDFDILYLHGGNYISQPTNYHWAFVDNLCKQLNARVFVPLYPLLPVANHQEAYDFLSAFYQTFDRKRPLILMGDGAGGALAAGLLEGIAKDGGDQPDATILISPWLDVNLVNRHISKIEKKDPLLTRYGLRRLGEMWAGTKSTYAYQVSPLYGNPKYLKNVSIIAGTCDITYPDAEKFYYKMDKKQRGKLIRGNKMIHSYPLFPIPEAKIAFTAIEKLINDTREF